MVQPVIAVSRHKQGEYYQREAGLLGRLLNGVRSVFSQLRRRLAASNQNYTLSQLNDHQLRDIGLTRDQVGGNPNRGIFDIPSQRYYDVGFRDQRPPPSQHPSIRRLPGE